MGEKAEEGILGETTYTESILKNHWKPFSLGLPNYYTCMK